MKIGRRFASAAMPSCIAGLQSRLPNRHGLTAKIAFVGIVFCLVPPIIYDRLDDADREKSQLLLNAAKEQGRLIALHLAPMMRRGLESLPEIEKALATLSNDTLNIRVLFRPKAPSDSTGFYYGQFYYVAASPGLEDSYLKSEMHMLSELGILSPFLQSCTKEQTVGVRHSAGNSQNQLITAVAHMPSKAGCWSVVTSYAGSDFVGSSFGRPYWQAPEIHFAIISYFAATAFTIFVLMRIRAGLRVFRNTAISMGRNRVAKSFAERNRNPDLSAVAVEFDRMVRRIGLFSFVVERCPSGISIANSAWRLEYVNSAYEKLSGKTSAELLGFDLRYKDFKSISDKSWFHICEQVEKGGTWHGEISRVRPDGRTLWARVSLYRTVPSKGGEVYFVCLQEDITEEKRILQNLVSERDRAESLHHMKSNFVARMSHEFRTPLNAILGFSEIIANETFGKCNVTKYIEYADNVHSSGKHLLSLINDVLDLSKLESGKEVFSPKALDMTALMREVLALVENEATKGQVTLHVGHRLGDSVLVADERALKQVLLNLLANAIKFTPPGGTVTVDAQCRPDRTIMLTVTDTGCGISKAEIPKVCEPYERSEQAYIRNRSGTGLGLPIVKRLVEFQHGKLRISSKLGVGTRVKVIFPPTS